jgi:hypothetical protein
MEEARMKPLVQSVVLLAGIAALSAARSAPGNKLSVVVANGPHAGTYDSKTTDVQCFHSRSQEILAATFNNRDPRSDRSGVQSGIRVYKPDAPGAKSGEVEVGFGPFAKLTTDYLITKIPITVTPKGKGADIAGEGKTKDGIQIRVSASCAEIQQW